MRARRASAQPPLRGLPRGRGEDESMSRARSRSPWAWPGGQRLRVLLNPGRHVDAELGRAALGPRRPGHGPPADEREAALVPVAVGDDVHGDGEPDLARDLEGLEVLAGRDALAMELEGLFVERLQPEEHVVEPQLLPVGEELLVLDQHVAPGLEVVLLPHARTLELLSDAESVL